MQEIERCFDHFLMPSKLLGIQTRKVDEFPEIGIRQKRRRPVDVQCSPVAVGPGARLTHQPPQPHCSGQQILNFIGGRLSVRGPLNRFPEKSELCIGEGQLRGRDLEQESGVFLIRDRYLPEFAQIERNARNPSTFDFRGQHRSGVAAPPPAEACDDGDEDAHAHGGALEPTQPGRRRRRCRLICGRVHPVWKLTRSPVGGRGRAEGRRSKVFGGGRNGRK